MKEQLQQVVRERDGLYAQYEHLDREMEKLKSAEEERIQLKKDNNLLKDELEARKQEVIQTSRNIEETVHVLYFFLLNRLYST